MNEVQSKNKNFSEAFSENEVQPLLSNFVNAWETQRYSDGHEVIGG